MLFGFDARQADEGRSFLSKAGGGNKLGEKIVDERVTHLVRSRDPELPCRPWDGEGLPREQHVWIEKGVVKNLSYSRYWAEAEEASAAIGASRQPGSWRAAPRSPRT